MDKMRNLSCDCGRLGCLHIFVLGLQGAVEYEIVLEPLEPCQLTDGEQILAAYDLKLAKSIRSSPQQELYATYRGV